MRFSKMMYTVAMAFFVCVSLWGQAAPEKKFKDRAEYDLYDAITKEQNPTKRLESLNTWKEKYADTDYKKERHLFYLTTYAQLNQPAKVIDSAKSVLEIDPKDTTSLYYITILTVSQSDTSAGALDSGEKAAKGLLGTLDTTFAKDKKPPTTTDAAWAQAREAMEATAHKTLGWVAISKKQFDVSEQEFKKELGLNPTDAQVSYWLGQSISGQKNQDKTSEALWHYARAATNDGAGALPPDFRSKVEDFLQRAYKGWHGAPDGLSEVKAQAKAGVMPPDGFHIKSVLEIEKEKREKEAAFVKDNPQLALWLTVKNALAATDGNQYFETQMKGTGLPKLKGTLVSQTPAIKPKTIVLALSDATTPEITLNLSAPLAGKADVGTVIEFEGAIATAFAPNPFMVAADVEKEKIEGWPAQAAPAPRRPAASKAGAKKKT